MFQDLEKVQNTDGARPAQPDDFGGEPKEKSNLVCGNTTDHRFFGAEIAGFLYFQVSTLKVRRHGARQEKSQTRIIMKMRFQLSYSQNLPMQAASSVPVETKSGKMTTYSRHHYYVLVTA